jgi:hypothetical protein
MEMEQPVSQNTVELLSINEVPVNGHLPGEI